MNLFNTVALRLFIVFFLIIILPNCSPENSEEQKIIPRKSHVQEETGVKLFEVKEDLFNGEILTNGKVYAQKKAEILYPVNERLNYIAVQNGSSVRKDQVLARMDVGNLKIRLDQTKDGMVKALNDLDDRLIDQGYRIADSNRVPIEVMKMAKIRSGYNNAFFDYTIAKSNILKTNIIAPFAGKIANLDAKLYEIVNASSKFCTLIDDHKMRAEFFILENEYSDVRRGSELNVYMAGKEGVSNKGVVTEVNPIIDNDGLIKVIGVIDNQTGSLLDGMNIKIVIETPISKQMSVPKQAVLKRQGKEVVFTYLKGKAKWNYVETGQQNSGFIVIRKGLQSGDQVITENNATLSHNSSVNVIDENSK